MKTLQEYSQLWLTGHICRKQIEAITNYDPHTDDTCIVTEKIK